MDDILLEPHPTPPGDTVPLSNHGVVGTLLDMARLRDTHTITTKNFQEDGNMNRAPTERFYLYLLLNTAKSITPY